MPQQPATFDLPTKCCEYGNHDRGFDLNVQWTCHRVARVYMLTSLSDDIRRMTARRDSTADAEVRVNLTNWLADADERLVQEFKWFAEDNPTCAVND